MSPPRYVGVSWIVAIVGIDYSEMKNIIDKQSPLVIKLLSLYIFIN